MINPYLPTRVNLNIPLEIGNQTIQNASFRRRFAAFWLDILILLLPFLICMLIENQSRHSMLLGNAAWLLLSIVFYVFLAIRYGGTPGKRLLKMRIVMGDGSKLSYEAAMLRYGIELLIALCQFAATAYVLMHLSDQDFIALGSRPYKPDFLAFSFIVRDQEITKLTAAFVNPAFPIFNAWPLLGAITMLCNKKRRAIHDFIAGTMVIHEPN